MKLTELKLNPKNPRVKKDKAFEKLKKSIEDFPKMLKLRPIIVDNDGTVLGGNMRLQALKDLGFKEIPDDWVKKASELTEDEKRRFIIADNVGFGDWDYEDLTQNWDLEELSDWGLEVPNWAAGIEANNMADEDVDLDQEFDPIGISSGLQRVVFIFDGVNAAESYLKSLNINNYSKKGQAWQVNMSIRSI